MLPESDLVLLEIEKMFSFPITSYLYQLIEQYAFFTRSHQAHKEGLVHLVFAL